MAIQTRVMTTNSAEIYQFNVVNPTNIVQVIQAEHPNITNVTIDPDNSLRLTLRGTGLQDDNLMSSLNSLLIPLLTISYFGDRISNEGFIYRTAGSTSNTLREIVLRTPQTNGGPNSNFEFIERELVPLGWVIVGAQDQDDIVYIQREIT